MKILQVAQAKQALEKGHIVALPTETVFGLAGDATNSHAIRKIFQVKQRPRHNPLICHCSSPEQISEYAHVPDLARKLFSLWPGPLTLLLPSKKNLPKELNNGGDWLAFRVPNHTLCLEILRALPFPLAMPSANKSGRESATSLTMVREQLGTLIFGGMTGHCVTGIESTIVQVNTNRIRVLRLGALPVSALECALQDSNNNGMIFPIDETQPSNAMPTMPSETKVIAPGMSTKHYAPKAPLLLLSAPASATSDATSTAASPAISPEKFSKEVLDKLFLRNPKLSQKIGFLSFHQDHPPKALTLANTRLIHFSLSETGDWQQAARRLYRAFYFLGTQRQCSLLVTRSFPTHPVPAHHLAAPLNDRLLRAATWQFTE